MAEPGSIGRPPSNQTADNSKRSKLIWRSEGKRIWLSKRAHNTCKLFKSYGIFNSDIPSCWANKSICVEIQIYEDLTLIVQIKFIDLMSASISLYVADFDNK